MDILPSKVPAPRLLSSVTAPRVLNESDFAQAKYARSGILRMRTRWWVLALILLAVVVFAAPRVHERYIAYRERQRDLRLLHVATGALTAGPNTSQTPHAITVEYAPDMVRVTAIALGHPRLAVINGRTVTEGDSFVVHPQNRNIAVTMRVERIADGHVDLFDGTHVLAAQLIVPLPKSLKQP